MSAPGLRIVGKSLRCLSQVSCGARESGDIIGNDLGISKLIATSDQREIGLPVDPHGSVGALMLPIVWLGDDMTRRPGRDVEISGEFRGTQAGKPLVLIACVAVAGIGR